MRIAFMGTPDFAAEHLKKLVEENYNVVGVFSQPDKPKGRGKKLVPTPVKQVAREYGIPVFQPKSVNKGEGFEALKELNPDIIITVAYGKLIKKQVFELPPLGCYNVHASLLPKYRGAAPIQRALENGEKETGITIFKIDEGMDSGPIALKERIEISLDDNFGTLKEKLCKLGQKLLIVFLEKISAGETKLTPQDHSKATYAPKITKEDTILIEFDDGERVFNKIRAYDPEPGVTTRLGELRVKLFGAGICDNCQADAEPGQIISIGKDSMVVACKKGAVKISRIQFPGKKAITVWQAKSGRLIEEGMKLGG